MRHANTEERNTDSNYTPSHETGRHADDYNRSNRAKPIQKPGDVWNRPAQRRSSAMITQSIPVKGIRGLLRSFALLFRKKLPVQS